MRDSLPTGWPTLSGCITLMIHRKADHRDCCEHEERWSAWIRASLLCSCLQGSRKGVSEIIVVIIVLCFHNKGQSSVISYLFQWNSSVNDACTSSITLPRSTLIGKPIKMLLYTLVICSTFRGSKYNKPTLIWLVRSFRIQSLLNILGPSFTSPAPLYSHCALVILNFSHFLGNHSSLNAPNIM